MKARGKGRREGKEGEGRERGRERKKEEGGGGERREGERKKIQSACYLIQGLLHNVGYDSSYVHVHESFISSDNNYYFDYTLYCVS